MNSEVLSLTFVSVPRTQWTSVAIPVQFGASKVSTATYNFDGSGFEEWVSSTSLKTKELFNELVQGSVRKPATLNYFIAHHLRAGYCLPVSRSPLVCPRAFRLPDSPPSVTTSSQKAGWPPISSRIALSEIAFSTWSSQTIACTT